MNQQKEAFLAKMNFFQNELLTSSLKRNTKFHSGELTQLAKLRYNDAIIT